MGKIGIIAKREVSSLFYSPIAYFVMFLFLIVMGFLFGMLVFVPGQIAEVRSLVDYSRFGLFFILPGITMSLFADEYRSGRMEMLRTSPIREIQLLLGKFLWAFWFFLILLAITLGYLLLLVIYGKPDWGQTFSAYVGLILLGCMFLSVGIFFSACTQNQIVAYLATLLVLGFFTFSSGLSGLMPATVPLGVADLPLRAVMNYLGVAMHIEDFAKGVWDFSNAAYFLIVSCFFLFLTYLLLESRKWR